MLKPIGRILAFFVTGFFIWSFFLVVLYRDAPPLVTPLMLLRLLDGSGIHKSWRPLTEISPNLIRAAMAAEDGKFCSHDGFDWKAIKEDWQRNHRGGQLLGASTISMQTAKNLFLWPDRSWPRNITSRRPPPSFRRLKQRAWRLCCPIPDAGRPAGPAPISWAGPASSMPGCLTCPWHFRCPADGRRKRWHRHDLDRERGADSKAAMTPVRRFSPSASC